MSGIGVVLNPFSKKYKTDPNRLERISFIIGDKASCKPTVDIDDLKRVAEEFKTRDIDILAISGGDGTIHCTLSTFLKVYGEKPLPRIYFLRGGTHNTITASLGVQGSTEELLSNLLVRYHEDKPFKIRKLRITRVNDEVGCIFGLGAVYRFMEVYYRMSSTLSHVTAVLMVVRGMVSMLVNGKMCRQVFKPFEAEITVNGKTWPFANYVTFFTGSVSQIGLGCNVFNSMLTRTDCVHAVGMSLKPRELFSQLPRMYLGKGARHPGILEEPAQNIIIRCAKPQPYTIDGDMYEGRTDFEIGLGPEVVVLV